MLCFLLLVSCSALKLSDPALKNSESENVSLQAWCVGTGCVMPFTPVFCQAWCDWNVDKQSDAEARGAFSKANAARGSRVVTATSFAVYMSPKADSADACSGRVNTYYFVKNAKTFVTKAYTFPGGDTETNLKTTEIQCNKCYLVENDAGKKFHIKMVTGPIYTMYPYEAKWAGETSASVGDKIPCSGDAGDSAKFTITDPTINTLVDYAAASANDDHKRCLGLKGLIWPKSCP